jgi:biopolymer transport protein ExbD
MKVNLDTPSEEARIEIIPLIDVIFCILTFFSVSWFAANSSASYQCGFA